MVATVLDRIASVVALHSGKTAVRYGASLQTFAELSQRAESIQATLHEIGVRPGDHVAVCLEPELDVPAVIVGVLRSGAVYVPIDPEYPRARIDSMLADIAPRVLVSRAGILERIRPTTTVKHLVLEQVNEPAGTVLPATVGPDDAATIFHTSGTTGRPKGAVALHRNVAYFAEAARERFGYRPGDVIPAIARFSFSISIFELLVPLSAGATVLMLDRAVIMDPHRLATALEEVTCFHAGPSLLRVLLRNIQDADGSAERFARVRHASSGGDMIPPQLLGELRQAFPRAEIFVIYGCTEISCMGCTDALPQSGPVSRTYVGLPFEGTAMRLVGDDGNTVAPGDVGEVWISGPGVVAGYWQREEEERARFVRHQGERWYRTGDLGRWSEGRGLELLGRSDFQVKVRGQRVEPAEVEFHLREIPGIREAAVVMRSLHGEPVLTAFVVRDPDSNGASAVDASALAARARRRLSERLPDYMVPAVVVELTSLPLNHNHKLDRRSLPELVEQSTPLDAAAAPQGPTERWLAGLWREVLSRDVVSRRHNFFELGGDSLTAQQVIVRAEQQRGVTIDAMALLREPLWVLATLVAPEGAEASPPTPTSTPTLTAFHFGTARDLFGLLAEPTTAETPRAALICQPIGAENVRATFVLALMAQRLAERGIPALRFDFFGNRDSLGDGHEGTLDRWRSDVSEAYHELRRRTGATEIIGIGVRLGAAMMLDAAAALKFEHLIAWDPVLDGGEFVESVVAQHRVRLAAQIPRFPPRRAQDNSGRRELLGFTWSTATLLELGSYRGTAPVGADLRTVASNVVWTEKTLELLPDSGMVAAILERIQ